MENSEVREKVMSGLIPAMVVDIRSEQRKGTLGASIDFESKWSELRDPIFNHPQFSTAFTLLKITEEEVKELLRKAYTECGVELW